MARVSRRARSRAAGAECPVTFGGSGVAAVTDSAWRPAAFAGRATRLPAAEQGAPTKLDEASCSWRALAAPRTHSDDIIVAEAIETTGVAGSGALERVQTESTFSKLL